jgi:hypothetical protein
MPSAQSTVTVPAPTARQITAQSYLATHPLFLSPNAVSPLFLKALPLKTLAMLESQVQRPECPMVVSSPAKVNDSMPVTRSAAKSEPMPVAKSPCVNPLGPTR